MKMTLRYDFGGEDDDWFYYEAEVDVSIYLEDWLQNKYYGVKDAVDDIFEDDDEDKANAYKCKNLDELASYMRDIDENWATSFVEEDDNYIDGLSQDDGILDEFEKEALEEYEDENDGCDPDGFCGWGDYYRWKNGNM